MAGEGFTSFMRQFRLPETTNVSTAHAWRQRYILSALMPE
jgi:hypothetical protein